MCGICGIFNFNSEYPVEEELIILMTKALAHRGPDGEGLLIEDNVGLGHRRLSITGLGGGHQPMANEYQTVWIVFNGQIYNYKELREMLIENGHCLVTRSDTEVIIHLYEDYGDECVNKLNGMFSFAIWDKPRKRILLARDRLGIKPLYYFIGKDEFVFSSELRSLLQNKFIERQLDFLALDGFFRFTYFPATRTMFKSIKKVLPGHLLTIEEGGKVSVERYWRLSFDSSTRRKEEYYVQELRHRLEESVRGGL